MTDNEITPQKYEPIHGPGWEVQFTLPFNCYGSKFYIDLDKTLDKKKGSTI